MERRWAVGVSTILSALLAGCALTQMGPADPPQTYDLVSLGGSSVAVSRAVRSQGLQLIINEPVALRSLASDRIAIRPSISEIRYFGKATWSDQLPRLVQARMVEHFERSGRFAAVASSRERLDADVAVATEIRAFQIELQGTQPIAKIDLQIRLIDQRRARVLAGRSFKEENYAGGDDVLSGVDALNTTMQSVLTRVASWAGGVKLPRPSARSHRRVREPALSDDNVSPDLRDSQTHERETDPNARPPISPDMLLGRRKRASDRL